MELNDYINFLEITYSKSQVPIALIQNSGDPYYLNKAFCDIFQVCNRECFNFFTAFQKEIPLNSEWLQKSYQEENFSQALQIVKEVDEKEHLIVVHLEIIKPADTVCFLVQMEIMDDFTSKGIATNDLINKILDLIPDSIYVKDIEGKFIFGNEQLTKLFGTTSKALIGKTDFDFFPNKLAKKYHADENAILKSGVPKLNIEEEVLLQDGRKAWYITSKVPLRNDADEIIGLVGIGKNISLQKQEQEALREAKRQAEIADQLKSAFMANMSHELRTPLNGILGFAQFLQQQGIPEDKRAYYVEVIFKNGKQLLQIINNVIELAKIDAGEVFIVKDAFDLNRLLKQIEQKTLFGMQQKQCADVQLELEMYYHETVNITTDFERLEQIMQNLLSNAIKFTNKGHIKFGYKPYNSDSLLFYISDTGIGIPKVKHDIIFKRFRQVDDSLTRHYGGLGLGLTITKGLVNLLGGKIWFESTVNKGTTFYFTVPIKSEADEIESEIKLDVNWRKKKILIAENEDMSYLFLEDIFANQYIEVDRARDEKELLEMLNNHDYSLIFVDFSKPDVIGLKVTNKIRAKNKDIAIVATSASIENTNRMDALNVGCDLFIQKPINKIELITLLNTLLTYL